MKPVKSSTAPVKTWFDSRARVDLLARKAAERGLVLVFSGAPVTTDGHGKHVSTYALVPHADSLVYLSRPPRTLQERQAKCQKCFDTPTRVVGYECNCGLKGCDIPGVVATTGHG